MGGNVAVFQSVKTYRPGAVVAPYITKIPLESALSSAKTQIGFLQVDSLKGTPINTALSSKTIDPFLASYVKDMNKAHFAE